MSPFIDAGKALFAHLLKYRHAELFPRFQNVNHVVQNSLHFLLRNFGRTDIHMSVDLHGIRRYNFTVYSLCESDGQLRLSHSRRTRQHYHWSFSCFRLFVIHYPFQFYHSPFLFLLFPAQRISQTPVRNHPSHRAFAHTQLTIRLNFRSISVFVIAIIVGLPWGQL